MRRRFLVLLLSLVVLSACQADVLLEVTVEEDGSGLVTLRVDADAAAVDAVPELADGLRTSDLEAGGWTVDQVGLGGGVRYTLSKPFGSPDALGPLIAEIAGPGLLFPAAAVEIIEEQDRREYSVSVTVDPTIEPADLSDGELTALLGGAPLGGLADDLAAADVSFTVRVTSPGLIAPVEETVALGDLPREVVASSAVVDDVAMALRDEAAALRQWAAIAVAVIVVALLVLAVMWLLEVRRRRRRRAVEMSEFVEMGVPVVTAPQAPAQHPASQAPPPPPTAPSAPPQQVPPATRRPQPSSGSSSGDGIDVDGGSWSPGASA